jgi:hypothetical protein
MEDLLRTKVAAKRLNLSPRVLEKWRWLGIGPRFVKIGRLAMYRESDLMEWIDSRVRNSTSDKGSAREG